MSKAKSAHYSRIIAEHSGVHQSLWQACNRILHRWAKMHLPDHFSITALANIFSSFFMNKISIIRSSFPSGSCSNVLTPPNTREVLHNLTHVTDDEVRRVFLSALCKSSDLDPIPTNLVKDCIDILVTPIVSIVNLSLSEGCFPSHFKSALVSPLLKKPTLNRNNMNNYRPVSNLKFLVFSFRQFFCSTYLFSALTFELLLTCVRLPNSVFGLSCFCFLIFAISILNLSNAKINQSIN